MTYFNIALQLRNSNHYELCSNSFRPMGACFNQRAREVENIVRTLFLCVVKSPTSSKVPSRARARGLQIFDSPMSLMPTIDSKPLHTFSSAGAFKRPLLPDLSFPFPTLILVCPAPGSN